MSWSRFFRRSRWDDERAREIETYLAIEIDENIARGMTPEDARRAAYRKFGNPTLVREEIYRMNTIAWLDAAWVDVRDALRQLRRRPLGLCLALTMLSIGVGASTAAFCVAFGVLARPLPYPDADRLGTIWQNDHGIGQQVSYPDLLDIRSTAPLSDMAALASGRGTLMGGGDVERVNLVEAEPALLPMLGARTALGRLLVSEDASQGVAVISRRLWTSAFNKDPQILGRTLTLSGRTLTVVGVLAEDLEFELPVGAARLGQGFRIEEVDLWLPLDPGDEVATNRRISTYEALVRLRSSDAFGEAQQALDTVARNLERQYPDTNRNRTFKIVPLHQQIVADHASAIYIALAGGVLILLVACGNLVSLFLSELPARRQDFALREALGAGRGRLMRQAAFESLIVSTIGGAAGVAIAQMLVRSFQAAVTMPRGGAIRFDLPVALFAVLSASAAGLTTRLLPLVRSRHVRAGLRDVASRYSTSAPRLRRTLVAAQIACAVVVTTAASLLALTLDRVLLVDPGYVTHDVLSLRVSAYASRFPAKSDTLGFFDRALERIRALPDVQSAGSASSLPLSGSTMGTSILVEGRPQAVNERVSAGWQTVTPGYFRTLGMSIREGRDFAAADREHPQHSIVINETLARQLFGSGPAIGRRIALGAAEPVTDWHEVIGVVGDIKHTSLTEGAVPRAYDLFGQHWTRTMFVVVRSRVDPSAVAASLRRTIQAVDPGVPVFDVRSLDDLRDSATAPRRASMVLSTGIALTTMLLAAVGIYGLLAGSVAARARELAIRRALGSSSVGVVRLVAGEGARMTVVGLIAGGAASLAVSGVLQSQLYAVRAQDPAVLVSALTAIALVSALATLVPARRAARVSPAVALRAEDW